MSDNGKRAGVPKDLFAAEPEFAQGHFQKSHAQNVPVRKSLRLKANARKMSCGDMKMREKCEHVPEGTGTRVRVFHSIPMSPPVVVRARVRSDVPLLWSYRREVGVSDKSGKNLKIVASRFAIATVSRQGHSEVPVGQPSKPSPVGPVREITGPRAYPRNQQPPGVVLDGISSNIPSQLV